MQDLIQQVLRYFQRLSTEPVTVAVQLVVIALVVYMAMRFLKGTRGERLLKGAVLLFVTVYIFIRLLPSGGGWERLNFLYGRFLFFAFMALVVVFQPELRRALMQLGQTRLFRSQAGRVDIMIDEIAKSSAYLSRNKIGALIAFERQVGLSALAENGVPLESRITAELLNTIFYPGSALHDMGVVIQDGRITSAGVQFPLAETGSTDRSLGSRHRAALGLSEESDAVVLVVSEETGRVSLAFDGQLSVGVSADSLKNTLKALLIPRAESPKPAPPVQKDE